MRVSYLVRCYRSDEYNFHFFDTFDEAQEYLEFSKSEGFLVHLFKCTEERIK